MIVDVLVIGSGVAGLTYAIKLADAVPDLNVLLISKNKLLDGNTRYAQGGIAIVTDLETDSAEKHIEDTIKAGGGAADKRVVDFVVREGKERLQELIAWGVEFDYDSDKFHLTKEGGHSEKRIVHYKDQTGLQIQQSLIDRVKQMHNVALLENHILVDLITDHHLLTQFGRCYGAYFIDRQAEKVLKVAAKTTVLCTGGGGQVFRHTTNPKGATGDGLGAAYRAKVLMASLPFIQFHPTVLYYNGNEEMFLISEALRGSGALLKNAAKQRFMPQYSKMSELAPRDVVARAIKQEIDKQNSDHVFLDCTMISLHTFQTVFPNIYSTCCRYGINPSQDLVPIVPAAHYFCGGIQVNEYGCTTLNGLYAIGECSFTGLHGANRLASNSLLEALVFSHRAAKHTEHALCQTNQDNVSLKNVPEWLGQTSTNKQLDGEAEELIVQLQEVMSRYAGVFKTNNGLMQAEKEINKLYRKTSHLYYQNAITARLCELRNMVSISYLIVKQSQEMTKNIGVFYNSDLANED